MEKVTWSTKEVIWGSIAITLSIWLIICILEENGFCTRKFAFHPYTEQDLIDKAISYKIKHIPSTARWEEGGEIKDIKIIPYPSVNDFKQKNPDCCTLVQRLQPEGNPPYTYGYNGFVKISYLRYYESDILSPEKYSSFIPYNSCGEITNMKSLF